MAVSKQELWETGNHNEAVNENERNNNCGNKNKNYLLLSILYMVGSLLSALQYYVR